MKKSQWYSQGTEDRKNVEAKKNERANALRKVKRLYLQFGFNAEVLKGSLTEERKSK